MEYFLCQLLWSVILSFAHSSLSGGGDVWVRRAFFSQSQHETIHTHSQPYRRMRERFCLFIVSMWILKQHAHKWDHTHCRMSAKEKWVSVKQCDRYKQIQAYAVGSRTHKSVQNKPMAMGITTTTSIHRKQLRHVRAPIFRMRLILIRVFAIVSNSSAFAACWCECAWASVFFFSAVFHLIFARCTYISHSSLNKQCQSPSNWFARAATG